MAKVRLGCGAAAHSNIERAIASITLRDKRDLILAFVDSVDVTADTIEDGDVSSWRGRPRSSTNSSPRRI